MVYRSLRMTEFWVRFPVSPKAAVAKLENALGLGPRGETLESSSLSRGKNKNFMKTKIIVLIFIIFFGLLVNYEEETGSFLKIFPIVKNPSLAFISLYKNNNKNFFQKENFWGWPFPYWFKKEFNLKSLFFDLIFYLIIWLILIFFWWFISAFKRFHQKRKKPPYKFTL